MKDDNIVINVENVSKKFKLYADRPMSLKEKIVKRVKKNTYKEFYALNDVSFKVKKGSTVGLIGKNGSGKSTLLKIINRTMFPDKGKISINGKIASLIELGAGFHPELSGRENIYNNATIFGFTKEEIDKRIPEIIAFSELEEFIDNTLRTYSSGMYARLAFSVAIHIDADILLVDEILGVGDINFQAKCANKIYEMKNNGTTIILVTHDMSTIDRLCDYAIWLEHGKIIADGSPKKIENRYLKFMAEEQEERKKIEVGKNINKQNDLKDDIQDENNKIKITHLGDHFGNGDVIFTDCKLLDEKHIDRRSFNTGQKIKLQVKYLCQVDPDDLQVNVGFEIASINGTYIYGTNTSREGKKNLKLNKKGTIEIELDNLNLLPGDYSIGIAIADLEEKATYDYYKNITEFKMYSNIHDIGLVRLEHKFIVDDKKIK
ncbi:vitamin B12 import ATP-binding protein BtuD [Leptotrichia shahii]|uniref:Vitamin B12 import ATP-binding protein BtuD n=1 Tax=Leptotrichia shahii TaxID=157691 RepID=A0A510JVY2_9FUSO|nr:ABC transporter ATP-binding protein [Leptotrichia shahii]BBM41663.1 vitamin B12 import ATP-binding protein BtuD [Leptotrichia shahii]